MIWLAIAILLYMVVGLYLFFYQEKLLFRPDLAPKEVTLPEEAQVFISDGLEVGVVDKDSDVTLFYFGGNADNALQILGLLHHLPYNIVTYNYPGYGRSKGTPSQEALYNSALNIFQKFRNEKNIIIGRSLGTAVAAFVAAKDHPLGVILITPFHSVEYLARLRYPIYPVSLILKHPFKEYLYIKQVKAPVFIILAQKDDITPPPSFEKLKPYITNLQKIVTIPGSTHGDILDHPQTIKYLKDFIMQIASMPSS